MVAAVLTAIAAMSTPANAAPIAFVAGGPLRPPGGFSQEGMHPVFTDCSLADFSTLTSATIATFIVRPNTNEAYFQITNRCGTYDATFRLGECRRVEGEWSCFRILDNGYWAIADYFFFQGNPALDATVYNPNGPEFWSVSGFLLTPGVTTI